MAGTAVYVLPNRIVLKMNKFIYSTTRTKMSPSVAKLLIATSPILLQSITFFFSKKCQDIGAYGWLLYLSILIYLIFWAPYSVWMRIIGISGEIGELFIDSTQQVRAIGFIHQRFRLGAQIVITLAFGVIGCWVVNYVNKYMLGSIFCMGPSQFLAAFLTLGFGMVGVYFSWVAPTFVGFLADVGLLNLELGYPSRTRGIREMNFILGRYALLMALIAAMLIFSLFWAYSILNPRPSLVLIGNTLVTLICVLTVSYVIIYPQFQFQTIILRFKDKVLESLSETIESSVNSLQNPSDLESLISTYQMIARSPNTSINLTIVIQFLLALIPAMLPWILSWIISQSTTP